MLVEKDKISKKSCKQCAQEYAKEYEKSNKRDRWYISLPFNSPTVFFPGEIHYLDGNNSNQSPSNRAMVCPHCHSHILLAAFDSEDIWLLKAKGLNYADIGRILGISRERVRQLYNRYQAKSQNFELSEIEINQLVNRVIQLEESLVYDRRIKRKMDKRTLKKRILAALEKASPQDIHRLKDDLG